MLITELHHKNKETDQLVKKCQSGDRKAQYTLYQNYSEAMINVAYRITGDEDEANDVLQESFVRVFKNLHQFDGRSTIGAWIKRIVVNQSINLVRKRKDLVYTEVLPETEEEVESTYDSPVGELEDQEIREAIDGLPDGYRVVLSLYLLEGYDHEEISQILGCTVGNSKSQYSRAKLKLKNALIDRYGSAR